MYESDKNFLERFADAIPGLKGYREKEARRETDKRLRDYLAAEIDRHRKSLEASKRDLMAKGKLELLGDVERVASKLQRASDALRFASYGYSGLFDQVKIEEQELDQIYEYDESLLDVVTGLGLLVAAVATLGDAAVKLGELEVAAEALVAKIDARKQIFSSPA